MKMQKWSQHVHWCVSVNSDSSALVYVAACEGCCRTPPSKGGGGGSRVGHSKWDKVKENVCG